MQLGRTSSVEIGSASTTRVRCPVRFSLPLTASARSCRQRHALMRRGQPLARKRRTVAAYARPPWKANA